MTDPEPEEYILTSDEESQAIEYALDQAKKHKAWRLKEMGFSEMEILSKLSQAEIEINRDEVLQIKNSNKHREIWNQKRRQEEKEYEEKRKADLRDRCTAQYFYQLMKESSLRIYYKHLIVNEFNGHLIKTLCYFLSNDEKFETEFNYSFKKGLLIRGISGLGKTHLVKCVSWNELKPIRVLNMIEISEAVKDNGEYFIQPNGMIYLDDVGTEEATINHYGTKINWFKDFIEIMYLRNYPFNNLIISTNNSFQEIEEKYGFRVRSRMKEMFNIIDIKGNDMRS